MPVHNLISYFIGEVVCGVHCAAGGTHSSFYGVQGCPLHGCKRVQTIVRDASIAQVTLPRNISPLERISRPSVHVLDCIFLYCAVMQGLLPPLQLPAILPLLLRLLLVVALQLRAQAAASCCPMVRACTAAGQPASLTCMPEV